MNNAEVKSKLGSLAESIRANIVYDLSFKFSSLEFFRLKMKNERYQEKKLSNALYKYNTNGY